MATRAPRPAGSEHLPAPRDAHSHADDGVDLTLIHWMLDLTPEQRLQAAQEMIDTVWMFRDEPSP